MAIAIEIAGHDSLYRRDLRDPRQRLEAIGSIGLAEENPAAEFRGREALRPRESVLPEYFRERSPRIIVILRIAFQERRKHRSQVTQRAPGIEAVPLVVRFDELGGTVALEVTGEDQRRVGGVGMILRVQSHIADHVVGSAVTVEVRRRK